MCGKFPSLNMCLTFSSCLADPGCIWACSPRDQNLWLDREKPRFGADFSSYYEEPAIGHQWEPPHPRPGDFDVSPCLEKGHRGAHDVRAGWP